MLRRAAVGAAGAATAGLAATAASAPATRYLATSSAVPGSQLNLAVADWLVNEALSEAARLGLPPLAVTVVNPAGQAIVTKRQDRCPNHYPKFAAAKAATCVGIGKSSRAFRDDNIKKGPQINAMVAISGGQMAPFAGGVLLLDASGAIAGAIGVSGASGDQDEHCAITAARLAEFATEPKESKL